MVKKKVTLVSKGSAFSESSRFRITETGPKGPTLISSSNRIVGVILTIPLIAGAVWLINLLTVYFTPVTEGIRPSPISANKIFALVAFMVGYSIFLGLFYFSKRKRSN